jgi:hypothetical protein
MPSDSRSVLLQALLARSGKGELPTTEDLVSELAGSDPTAGIIAQYLAQRRVEEAEHETSADEDEETDALRIPSDEWNAMVERNAQLGKAFRGLRQEVESLYGELEDLRARNDKLAAALGACYLCWGLDVDCPTCGGQGLPGTSSPDRRLFAQLVAPAIRRLQRHEDVVDRRTRLSDPPSWGAHQRDQRERSEA